MPVMASNLLTKRDRGADCPPVSCRHTSPVKPLNLEDIPEWYRDESFLVAKVRGTVIGTGALIREDATTGRIVRMSVDRACRRKGVATEISNALKEEARDWGFTKLVVETTSSWKYVIHFYLRNHFRITGYRDDDGEVDFLFDL